jgi:hypothetical protein
MRIVVVHEDGDRLNRTRELAREVADFVHNDSSYCMHDIVVDLDEEGLT